uniref:Uncharacterized protein n=1 Tax=Romanomermis culicivorax TaxID=13658 RepID=A0A915KWN4_ROMCU
MSKFDLGRPKPCALVTFGNAGKFCRIGWLGAPLSTKIATAGTGGGGIARTSAVGMLGPATGVV